MTDQERKAMEMALKALEDIHRTGDTQVFDMCDAPVVIPALRTALAQPEHYSDCAVHNEPAYPKGECDCKTKSPEIIPTVPDNMQDWAKLDGATAWLLMERHANNWSDIEKMMDEFVAAKVALAQPEQMSEPIYLSGQYVGEGKVVSIKTGLPDGAIQEACHMAKLAQPEQEPIAWLGFNERGECREIFTPAMKRTSPNYPTEDMTPVYTAPPNREWVGLTDEEIEYIYKQNHNQYGEDITGEYERELEAKLKEKNNG